MPIGPYETFDACVIGVMREEGVDDLSARKICGKMEAEASLATLEQIRAAALNKPVETFEVGGNRYGKFFLLSTKENQNAWSVTAESIPQYLQSFVGMPFVSDDEGETGAAFDHLGLQPPFNKSVNEVLRIQERPTIKAGTIIDVQYKPEMREAYAVVRFENTPHGRKVFDALKNGEAIYTSPAITGYARNVGGAQQYYAWYGVHLARVKNPAYGVMAATIKATCEGPEKTCLMQLATAAKRLGMPCILQMSEEDVNSSLRNETASGGSMADNNANDIAALKKQLEDANAKVASLTEENAALKTQVKANEGLASKFESLDKSYKEMEAREKKAIASEIAQMEVDAEITAVADKDKRVGELSSLSMAALESERKRLAPFVEKIKGLASKAKEHPLAGPDKLVHQVASASDGKGKVAFASINDVREKLPGLVA